jgi:hypothetical protein
VGVGGRYIVARYRRATSLVTNLWLDTETGETFGESDTEVLRRFRAWVAAGNTPDDTPVAVVTAPDPTTTRPGKIARLAQTAKAALAAPSISTPGEKLVATVFGQALDALAQLDPLPSDPVTITLDKAPDQPMPIRAPAKVMNAGKAPVGIQ